jgi:hypothetical protein
MPHLRALILRGGATEALGQARDFAGTPASKLALLSREAAPTDIVFVHRDADKAGSDVRRSEIARAAASSSLAAVVFRLFRSRNLRHGSSPTKQRFVRWSVAPTGSRTSDCPGSAPSNRPVRRRRSCSSLCSRPARPAVADVRRRRGTFTSVAARSSIASISTARFGSFRPGGSSSTTWLRRSQRSARVGRRRDATRATTPGRRRSARSPPPARPPRAA